ncbi:MAG: single-stranded DNA-binding protein [Verrucomicrobia bacterium]|nr:single-stranded DNA-binding protein [Verrucomicrobiota bacterium]
MNLMQIVGNLGSDPEESVTPDGQKVVSFRIAVNTRKKGKDITVWYRVTIWGDRFDRMLPYIKKGSSLLVIGELQKPEIYTDRNGQPQISLDITADILKFLPGKGGTEGQAGLGAKGAMGSASPAASIPLASLGTPMGASVASSTNFDDDLPF